MSSLFNCTLTLKPSKDYYKLVVVVNLLAFLALTTSGLHWLFKSVGVCLLLNSLIKVRKNQRPESDYEQLVFNEHQRSLITRQDQIQHFRHHRILIEIGVFFMIAFYTENSRKVLFVFFDQLSDDEFRKIKILQKIA